MALSFADPSDHFRFPSSLRSLPTQLILCSYDSQGPFQPFMGRMRHTHQQERRARSTIKSLLMRASLQASQVKPCSLTHEILLCFTFQANTLEDILWWCFPSEHRISSSYFPIFPLIFPFISPFFGHTSLCCPHFLLNPPLSSYSPTFSAHFLPFSPLFSPFPIYFPSSPPFSQFSFHFPLRFPPFSLTFLHFSHSFPHSSLFFSSFPLPISSLSPFSSPSPSLFPSTVSIFPSLFLILPPRGHA